jgi:membrane-bound lytic murein transglycosylase D
MWVSWLLGVSMVWADPATPSAESTAPVPESAPQAAEVPTQTLGTTETEAKPEIVSPGDVDEWAKGTISTELNPADFDIPVEINPYVMQWLKYFTGPGRPTYATWMIRAQTWRPTLHKLLAEEGAPADLVYLSMIESGYSNTARSWAGAVGMWQFIPGTGRAYGLKVGRWVDERRDPIKATRAAASFLKELYARYDNWHLAFAAYNCGPGCVDGAVAGYRTTDFWTLVKRRALPQETMHYVPKILAAAIIGKHPQRYGFSDIQAQSKAAPIWPSVPVDASIGLDVVADCYRADQASLERLNPQLIEWALPPDGTALDIRVPLETQGAADCLRRLR